MEDSLENYLKLSENAKVNEPIGRKEEIKFAAQRKKECADHALKIVNICIEGRIRPDVFIRCLRYINPSYYQDIIEERAMTELCGYPVCGKKLSDLSKQQYCISVKSNKIYDITDRKNFCSNGCYKASLHIKKQIASSPLWSRNFNNMPEYQLLSSHKGGLPGKFVDHGIVKPVVQSSFTSVSAFAEVSLNDLVEKEQEGSKSPAKDKTGEKKVSKLIKPMQTISEDTEHLEEEEGAVIVTKGPEAEKSHAHITDKMISAITENDENIESEEKGGATYNKVSKLVKTMQTISENTEQLEMEEEAVIVTKEPEAEKSHLPAAVIENEGKVDSKSDFNNLKNNSESSVKVNSSKPKKKRAKTLSKIDPEAIIKKVVKEWFTLETYIFIYGEKKVKEIFNEKKMSDYFENLKIGILETDQQFRYMELCKRLHLQEMADKKFDNAVVGHNQLKPLPDFQKLMEESKDLNLSVKCFYSGVIQEKNDSNCPAQGQENVSNNDEGTPAVLPLVDVSSQKAMRRNIFSSAAAKAVQNLLQAFRVRSFSAVQSDIQALVKTFKLRADNIVFVPLVWNFIAILLLKILSLKDQNIMNILDDAASQSYIKLLLSSLRSKGDFIADIMSDIQNIEMFVELYISCN